MRRKKSAFTALSALVLLVSGSLFCGSMLRGKAPDVDNSQSEIEGMMPAPLAFQNTAEGHKAKKDLKRERKEYQNQLRGDVEVDWREIEQKIRQKNRDQILQERQEQRDKMSLLSEKPSILETFGNGTVTGKWVERGSNNLSGRMMVADYDPATKQIVAGSHGGVVWIGNLDGEGWQSLNDYAQFENIKSVNFIPTPSGKRIVAVHNYPATVGFTDDVGGSWTEAKGLEIPARQGHLRRGLYNKTRDTYYVLSVENPNGVKTALYRSTDHCENFTRLDEIVAYGGDCDMWLPTDGSGDDVYLLNKDTLMILDGSDNLVVQGVIEHPEFDMNSNGRVFLTGCQTNSATYLYALYEANNPGTSLIYASSDEGKTWEFRGFIADASLRFDIDVPEAGEYEVVFRYKANDDMKEQLYVNGINEGSISFDEADGWSDHGAMVFLEAGSNTLTLERRYDGGISLDYVEIPTLPVKKEAETATLSGNYYTHWDNSASGDNFVEFVKDHPFGPGDNSFTCSSLDPEKLYIGTATNCVFSSVDGGEHWSFDPGEWGRYYDDPDTNLHADIPAINVFRDAAYDEIMLISTDGGIYVSYDHMESVENISLAGLRISQYYDTYTGTDTSKVFAGSQDQGFQAKIEGENSIYDFKQWISGDYGSLVSGDEGNSIYGTYCGGSLVYWPSTSTNTYRWKDIPNNTGKWFPPMMPDPNDAEYVYVGNGSTHNGQFRLWRISGPNSSAVEGTYDFEYQIWDVESSPIDRDYWYVVTENGFFYSQDAGTTWTKSLGIDVQGNLRGRVIVASPTNLGTVYIGRSGYEGESVLKSVDNGVTFTHMASGIPGVLVEDMAITPNSTKLFAATPVGAYIYTTAKGEWERLTGITGPDQEYKSVEYIPITKTARFGTYGRGIWDFVIEDSSSCEPSLGEFFAVPSQQSIPAINSQFHYAHVLGDGPDLSNVSTFTINWEPANNGLYQMSVNTTNGNPNWYVDLRSSASWTMNTPNAELRLSGSGFSGLDGEYWVALHEGNLVWVDKSESFAVYFSESETPPEVGGGCDRFVISAETGDHGTIDPAGDITVDKGAALDFTITPDAGYHIEDVMVDGQSIGTVSLYSFADVSENHTIYASFGQTLYTITASANAHGSITPSGTITVNEGSSQTFSIVADPGYIVYRVYVNGGNMGSVTSYTVEDIHSDVTVEAYFVEDPNPVTYTITATAEENGSISPAGDVQVQQGENQSFSIVADPGYVIYRVYVNNVNRGSIADYTFEDVHADGNIEAYFAVDPNPTTYSITATAHENGSITPNGNVSVEEGSDQSFSIVPDPGYMVYRVYVNGGNMGAVENYTFENVQSDGSIVAYFSEDPSLPTHLITAVAGPNGTISPEGSTSITHGDEQTYTIMPASQGYRIEDVLVDGVSVGAVSTYTFTDVNSDHTIEASFVEKTPLGTIVVSSTSGGGISPDGTITDRYIGDHIEFTLEASSGYTISDLIVDGNSLGAVSQYMLEITGAYHTVEARFEEEQAVGCDNIIDGGQTGNLGTTDALCFKTSDSIQGWGGSNMQGRTVSVTVNGQGTPVTEPGAQLPPKGPDDYYVFEISSGGVSWASIYWW